MKLKSSRICILVFILVTGLFSVATANAETSNVILRNDGLTTVRISPDKKDDPVQYLTLIVKTGSASDPSGKAGLMLSTSTILYYYFNWYTPAAQVAYSAGEDFTYFEFKVAEPNRKAFMEQLDTILRYDVFLSYDLTNWMLYLGKTQPHHPAKPAADNFYEMIYGPDHPYNHILNPNYNNLNINEINKWFRRVYRPNNFIVASSFELPEDFLRRPVGKEFKAPVGLPPVPSPKCENKPAIRFAKVHDNSGTVLMGFPGPKISNEDYFAFRLGAMYLEEELTLQLRENAALVYSVEPDYAVSAMYEPTAPNLTITFQTIPEDTGTTIAKTVAILENLAKNGIPKDRLVRILERERIRRTLQDKELSARTSLAALQAYHNQNWINNSDEYLNRLERGAKDVAKVYAQKLPYLKISVAGPEGVEESLKNVNLNDLK